MIKHKKILFSVTSAEQSGKETYSTSSIPQNQSVNQIAIEMEPAKRHIRMLDDFKGNVREFRAYLKIQLFALKEGIPKL